MICGGLRTKGIFKKNTDTHPLLSIVTVVYNGEKHLEQTIQSVLNQTYNNIEYIIIDGSSSDKTLDIIKKYEDKIDLWQSEPDKGIYDAMNKGIDLSTGDFIALLNADDWYELDTCETIVNKISEEKADIYYGMLRIIDENNDLIEIQGPTVKKLHISCIAHPTCFVRKSIYSVRKYDLLYKSASDYDFICEINKRNFSFCFIEKILTNFRSGGMSAGMVGCCETYKIRRKYNMISFKIYFFRILICKLQKFLRR